MTNSLVRPSQVVVNFGRKLGIRLCYRSPILALKRLLLPVEYIRCIEFQYVLDNLEAGENSRVLDIGSPKMLGLYLGNKVSEIFLTDYDDYFISPTLSELSAVSGKRGYQVETQDARNLTYDDASFDRIFSVSVIEHIDVDGDSVAIREMERVLKPGGRVCITVPHDDGGYRDVYKSKSDPSAYWLKDSEEDTAFYQRIYDGPSLRERIVEAAPRLKLVDLTYYGETEFGAEHFLLQRPLWQKIWMYPFHSKFAERYCTQTKEDTPTFKKVACVTLQKE